jgi:hypothetical protein
VRTQSRTAFGCRQHLACLQSRSNGTFPGRIDSVNGWSTNSPHFHNSLFIQRSVKAFRDTLGLTRITWSSVEPGEGKCYCDIHIADVSGVFKRYVATNKDINGMHDVRALLDNGTHHCGGVRAESGVGHQVILMTASKHSNTLLLMTAWVQGSLFRH